MRNFIAILITFVPILLLNVYFLYDKEPNSGINWYHSIIGAIVFALSYNSANYYRKNDKVK